MLTVTLAVSALVVTMIEVNIQAAYAQLVKDPGASGLTPKEQPQIPGWDPNGAADNAPGQLAEGPHCIGCAKDFTPGQQGLTSGIIGPELKK